MYCHSCSRELNLAGKPGVRDLCPHCSAYLHCCYHCRFYDANAYQQCREPQAEFVKEKDKGNHCEYFEVSNRPPGKVDDRAAVARQKLEQLFKKK